MQGQGEAGNAVVFASDMGLNQTMGQIPICAAILVTAEQGDLLRPTQEIGLLSDVLLSLAHMFLQGEGGGEEGEEGAEPKEPPPPPPEPAEDPYEFKQRDVAFIELG
jgi:hypothetical protein